MQNKMVVRSLGNAVAVLVYVSLVAFVMNHANQWFGKQDTGWTPIAVLMLFVTSAAVTGSLVLARPAMMFYEGAKKQAVMFLAYTIGWLAVLTLLVFAVMAMAR